MSKKPRDYHESTNGQLVRDTQIADADWSCGVAIGAQMVAYNTAEARRLGKYLLEWADWKEAKDE